MGDKASAPPQTTAYPQLDPNYLPPAAPPSYNQAIGGAPASNTYAPYGPYATGHPKGHPIGIVTTVVPVGPQPTHMICPHCHAEIETSIKKEPGLIAYISGFLIALFGFWCGCCLIPCCIDSCMDVHHNCPNCNAYLGRFKR